MNPKQEILLAVLSRSWAFVQLDGRADGVSLPDWLRGPEVTLQLGYDMPLPIDDLRIDEHGVSATLSFRRTPHLCKVPWAAVWGIADVDGQGVLFPEDVPPELRPELLAAQKKEPPRAQPARVEPPPPSGTPGAQPTDSQRPDDEAPAGRFKNGKPRPSHLKLV